METNLWSFSGGKVRKLGVSNSVGQPSGSSCVGSSKTPPESLEHHVQQQLNTPSENMLGLAGCLTLQAVRDEDTLCLPLFPGFFWGSDIAVHSGPEQLGDIVMHAFKVSVLCLMMLLGHTNVEGGTGVHMLDSSG